MNTPPADPLPQPNPSRAVLSREGEAQRDLGTSVFAPGAKLLLLSGFLVLICAGLGVAWISGGSRTLQRDYKPAVPCASLFPSAAALGAVNSPGDLWRLLPSPAATRGAEKALEDNSVLVGKLRPLMQALLVRVFREGNQQVVIARGGGLFFRKDLDYVNGKPFLDANRIRERAVNEQVAADPLPAICDFQKQLAARGIRLILVPVPVKPCVEGHQLVATQPPEFHLRQNAAFAQCVDALRARDVEVFDAGPLLLERSQKSGRAQYLATDTHWTPDAMEAVARAVAAKIEPLKNPPAARPAGLSVSAHGDTVALLGLSKEQTVFPAESVEIHPVLTGSDRWQSSPSAKVLLLGDSFSNIYSLGQMGWGEGAGFAEQLSAALGQPVDAILRNSDGALATRQMLQQELAMGRDRLAGKKVVVWEFAVRELSFGDWKLLPLEMGHPSASGFYCPPKGKRVVIEGTVAGVSSVPRPGSVPYKEHIMSVRLADVVAEGAGVGGECLVYTWSMREQQLSGAARLRPGDRVRWEVCAWEDVQSTREKFQRSELEDPAVLLEAFVWFE